jgi:hypothetical protein
VREVHAGAVGVCLFAMFCPLPLCNTRKPCRDRKTFFSGFSASW